jgi:hypothetical protein
MLSEISYVLLLCCLKLFLLFWWNNCLPITVFHFKSFSNGTYS